MCLPILAHPAAIEHLHSLGVTTVELLPIHASFSEAFLLQRGLTNYWGYSTLSYFVLEPTYATAAAQAAGPQAVLDELRGMVSLLHEAGLEVIVLRGGMAAGVGLKKRSGQL